MAAINGKVKSHPHARTAKCNACYRPTSEHGLYRVANGWHVCRRDLSIVHLFDSDRVTI